MLPQPNGEYKEIVRSYTPISGDEQAGHFDLLIKSYPTGNISKHLASLAVGQSIRVRGPKGAFTYKPNMVRHFGMIAGGTGITPMLQVVKAIIRGRQTAGDRTEVDLIFANVTEKDILLKEDLDALAAEDKGFRVHYVLDKPPAGWTGGVGFVTAEMIQVRFRHMWHTGTRSRQNANVFWGCYRNGYPSLRTMSKSCSADLPPWSVVSRRPPNLSVSRRPSPSASSRTRSSHSKRHWTASTTFPSSQESDLDRSSHARPSHTIITPRCAVLPSPTPEPKIAKQTSGRLGSLAAFYMAICITQIYLQVHTNDSQVRNRIIK